MKKGFTLIELLAVIVILAIIALIATPIILGIIEDARKGSIEASANGYIDAVEYKIASNEIKGTETSSGIYDINDLDIDLDGSKPTSGSVTIEKGNVKEASLCIDGHVVDFKNNTSKVIGTCTGGYKEAILNGADPQLKDELVPVTISNKGVVTKADINKKWYKYNDKEWANAVILFGEDDYKAGDQIEESDIKEYYVWIPRYAYRLWNVNGNSKEGSLKPIEIVFGSKASTTGKNNGDMYLHPAFTNFKTQGIWVGKFETSYNEETYVDKTTFLSVNPNYEQATDPKEIIIKPNVRSLSNKSLSEYHELLINSHSNLNSHVMTNMEWGATAYLTYSIYGRCDDTTCTEVTINNVTTGHHVKETAFEGQWKDGTTITGCGANNVQYWGEVNKDSCTNSYESAKGVLASTTGNITGIYDMSGGNWEYVMGVLGEPDGTLFSGKNNKENSGFKGIYGCPGCNDNTSGITENTDGIDFPNNKYYNIYQNNYELSTEIWYDYTPGLLGDATKEVNVIKDSSSTTFSDIWFNDGSKFLTTSYPIFIRSGSWGAGYVGGLFTFNPSHGGINTHFVVRSVLAF